MKRAAAMALPVCLLVPVAVAAHAAGEAPAPVLRLTLEETIDRAAAASPDLRRLHAMQAAAEQAERGAVAARMPELDVEADYARLSHVPELVTPIPGGSTVTIFPDLPDRYGARLTLSLPLYVGGRIASSSAAARHSRRAAALDVESGVNDLTLEATVAYWELVTARETERVLARAVEAYDSHLRDARNRRTVGMAAANEVLAVRVERDQAELARLQAVNQARLVQADLLRLLDLPGRTRIEPVEGIEADVPDPGEPEELAAEARSRRSSRAALAARVAAAEARVAVARSARHPQASLAAEYAYANPNTRVLPLEAEWQNTWGASVRLGFRLFDGGRTAAAVGRARAEADAARHRLETLDRAIRLEVNSAWLRLDTARAALRVAERNLEAATENRRVARDRYREGLIPSSELLDAETALLRAGLDRTTAWARLRIAAAELDRAAGR